MTYPVKEKRLWNTKFDGDFDATPISLETPFSSRARTINSDIIALWDDKCAALPCGSTDVEGGIEIPHRGELERWLEEERGISDEAVEFVMSLEALHDIPHPSNCMRGRFDDVRGTADEDDLMRAGVAALLWGGNELVRRAMPMRRTQQAYPHPNSVEWKEYFGAPDFNPSDIRYLLTTPWQLSQPVGMREVLFAINASAKTLYLHGVTVGEIAMACAMNRQALLSIEYQDNRNAAEYKLLRQEVIDQFREAVKDHSSLLWYAAYSKHLWGTPYKGRDDVRKYSLPQYIEAAKSVSIIDVLPYIEAGVMEMPVIMDSLSNEVAPDLARLLVA